MATNRHSSRGRHQSDENKSRNSNSKGGPRNSKSKPQSNDRKFSGKKDGKFSGNGDRKFSGDSDRKFSDKKDGKFSGNNDRKFSGDSDRKFSDKKDGKFSGNNDRKFSGDNDRKFSDKKDGKFSGNSDRKFSGDNDRKFSDKKDGDFSERGSRDFAGSNDRKFTGNKYRKDIKKPVKVSNESDGIRLNKYISNSGICSRRDADKYIDAGSATVNGKVITEMGYKVKEDDEVRFDGTLLNPETKRYILLNKPKNYITTMDDERGRRTVMDLIKPAAKERVYPVGRLDRNTTGLLLFTNDGEMARKLTHPKHKVRKIYHVSLDKKLSLSDFEKIANGFDLDGRKVLVDEISYIEGQKKSEIGLEIHSGRNRIVRRIFEHFGYTVGKLDRVSFAGLTKKDIARGRWRHLTQQELNYLKMI